MNAEMRILDRYVLLDPIADGATAKIYRAFQSSSQGIGRVVALKIYKSDFFGSTHFTLPAWKVQIQTMMSFNHPNIVAIFEVNEERPGVPYVAMECIAGKNLRQLIIQHAKNNQRIPVEFCIFIAKEVAKALQYSHSYTSLDESVKGILHRNLSTQNIMVSFDGDVKLIEFGVKGQKKQSETAIIKMNRGRAGYTSPEELNGRELTARSDIFSLGVILWESLVGQSLFTSPKRNETLEKIKSEAFKVRPPSTLNPKVPAELDAIVLKMLERAPENRFASAHELVFQLERLLDKLQPDFSQGWFEKHLRAMFQDFIRADSAQIKAWVAEAEEVSRGVVPQEKGTYLRKLQDGEDPGDVESKIMISKQKEGAVGSRVITVEKKVESVQLNMDPDALTKGGIQRGGYVKRAHLEDDHEIALDRSPLNNSGSFNRNGSKTHPRAPIQKINLGAWITNAVLMALVLLLLLPKLGFKLGGVSDAIDRLADRISASRSVAGQK